MDYLREFNVVLAGVGLFGTLGAVAAMNGKTNHLVRFAVVLLLIGFAAQVVGPATGQWDYWADTLVFGGIAVYLLASRRMPTCFIDRFSPAIGWGVGALTALATFAAWSITSHGG